MFWDSGLYRAFLSGFRAYAAGSRVQGLHWDSLGVVEIGVSFRTWRRSLGSR